MGILGFFAITFEWDWDEAGRAMQMNWGLGVFSEETRTCLKK